MTTINLLTEIPLIDIALWTVLGLALIVLLISMVVQLRRQKELKLELAQLGKLKKRNVEYEFVLKAMRLATWHIDAKARTITYDNDLRGKADSYVPQPETPLDDFVMALAEQDRQRVLKALDDICSGRSEDYHVEYQVSPTSLRKAYWMEAYATVAERDIDGMPTHIVGTSLRIDERKTMENDLVAARNRAEESDRLKSAFIANMSHEIRTPLNAIIGFTSLLPDITGDEERRQLIDLIAENNQKLLRIIDDVMNISKIEAGEDQLVMTAFDLNTTLLEVVGQYADRVKPGVTMNTLFASSALQVTTDRNRIMEVMNHLISNAVKFTDQGSVIVGYDNPEKGRLRLWVRDTGKGIAAEHQERIFERFFKVDEFIPGAGLGLSTCRTMAYSMGGSLEVESKLGEGSTFSFEFPVQ